MFSVAIQIFCYRLNNLSQLLLFFHYKKSKVRGCGNQLTGDGINRHEGYNYCNHCHNAHFASQVTFLFILPNTDRGSFWWNTHFQFYGVPPGAETIEEQALREACFSLFGNVILIWDLTTVKRAVFKIQTFNKMVFLRRGRKPRGSEKSRRLKRLVQGYL